MHLRSIFAGFALLAILAPASALAAVITTNEAGMDAIYGQGTLNIDIRFNAAVKVTGPTFLGSAGTEAAIHALAPTVPANTVVMFFIDLISWCDVFDPNIAGCAQLPGDKLILESAVAAGASGAELNSHELGHNLNLTHTDPNGNNLMFGTLNGNTVLTGAQMNTILASALVQTDGGGNRFISITPVLVTPEPATAALFAAGVLGLIGVGRRWRM